MGPPCPGEAGRAEAPRGGPGASEGPAGRVGVRPERDCCALGPVGASALRRPRGQASGAGSGGRERERVRSASQDVASGRPLNSRAETLLPRVPPRCWRLRFPKAFFLEGALEASWLPLHA